MMFFLPIVADAQTTTDNVQLGFTTSPNIGWLSIDNNNSGIDGDGVRTGFSYGVLADIGFARNYYFSTAFTLTTINGKTTEKASGMSFNNIYKVGYIEVPATLKLKSNPTAMGRFYGQFGLSTGIKIKAKGSSTEKVLGEPGVEGDNSNLSDVNTFRLGLVAGAGAEWNVNGNLNILTGITYNNGFTRVVSKGPDMRNSYLALTLGVFF